MGHLRRVVHVALVLILVAACSANPSSSPSTTQLVVPIETTADTTADTPAPATPVDVIPGMPPVVDPTNLYSEAAAGKMSPAVENAKSYVYVPSDTDGTITVIDQATMAIVREFPSGGKLTQHVVSSHDMTTLYANVSGANKLLAIDPTTGLPGKTIQAEAPYNLYFTPDGTRAVVMAERVDTVAFYRLSDWHKVASVKVPCTSQTPGVTFGGVNHADWSADGRYFLATCEFSGDMIQIDTLTMTVTGQVHLKDGAMPQDVRIMPDGKHFFVADMNYAGVWIVDGDAMTVNGFIPTGVGAHGIYLSRDASVVYVANRGRLMDDEKRRSTPGDGSVSVIDWRNNKVQATWTIPSGGSPDMGGVSADGTTLWLSGRFDSEVYAFDTTTGLLRARIKLKHGQPHGLLVWPQPGRYSLGHTGITR